MSARYYISEAMLRRHNACQYQYERFVRIFGKTMIINEENLRTCVRHDLPMAWPAYKLLSKLPYDARPNSRYQKVRRIGDRLTHMCTNFTFNSSNALKLYNELGQHWARYKREQARISRHERLLSKTPL